MVAVAVEWFLFLLVKANLGRDGEVESEKGRHLRRAIPQLHLEVWGRLGPSSEIPDPGMVYHMTELTPGGLRLVLRRPSMTCVTYHPNHVFGRVRL